VEIGEAVAEGDKFAGIGGDTLSGNDNADSIQATRSEDGDFGEVPGGGAACLT